MPMERLMRCPQAPERVEPTMTPSRMIGSS